MSKKVYKLSEIAELLDLSLDGDGEKRIASINNLKNAKSSELSFYYSKKFKKDLENTKAGAIILSKEDDFDLYIDIAKYSCNGIPHILLSNDIFKKYRTKKRYFPKRDFYGMD